MARTAALAPFLLTRPSLASAQAPAASPQENKSEPIAFARAEGPGVWAIGSERVERRLRLGPDGKLSLVSLHDPVAGLEWCDPTYPSDEFRVDLRWGAGQTASLTGAIGLEAEIPQTQIAADGRARLSFGLRHPASGLLLRLAYESYPGTATIRQGLELVNQGGQPLTVERLDTFRTRVAAGGGTFKLNWLTRGELNPLALDLFEQYLPPGNSWSLRSTCDLEDEQRAIPWFVLTAPPRQAGLVLGWEWSSEGLFQFGDTSPAVWLTGGLDPAYFRHILAPGETLAGPWGFLGLFAGDLDAAAQVTRDLVETWLAPPVPDERFPLVHYNTWYALFDQVDEANVASQLELAAQAGLESFVVDYGWFPRPGDWWPDPQRFPNGLKALSDAAHAQGLRFGLWLGMNTVAPEAAVVQQHPDWLARVDGQAQDQGGFGLALCTAHQPVRDWLRQETQRVVREYGCDWLLHDLNLLPRCHDPGHTHQVGDTRYVATRHLYEILDALRAVFPALIIENCSNGGHIMDYGMLQRSHTFAISDYSDSRSNVHAAAATVYPFPPRYAEAYMADELTPRQAQALHRGAAPHPGAPSGSPSPASGRGGISGVLGGQRAGGANPAGGANLPADTVYDNTALQADLFQYRSAMLGVWAISVDFTQPSWQDGPARFRTLQDTIARYKQDRRLLRDGVVSHLLPLGPQGAPVALLYWLAVLGQGVILAFAGSTPGEQRLMPRGLDPALDYLVTVGSQAPVRWSGRDLTQTGLSVGFSLPYESQVVRLQQDPSPLRHRARLPLLAAAAPQSSAQRRGR